MISLTPHNLASPDMPGDRDITTSAACEALEFFLSLEPDVSPGNADMLIQMVCQIYRRGEIEVARKMLRHHCDLTAVYRIEAILHTPAPDERVVEEWSIQYWTDEGAGGHWYTVNTLGSEQDAMADAALAAPWRADVRVINPAGNSVARWLHGDRTIR